MTNVDDAPPYWRGVNHLALITSDMDATVRFYHGVLGARVVSTIGNAEFRHYFFEFGPECTVAFFEYKHLTIAPFAKRAGVPDPHAAQFDRWAKAAGFARTEVRPLAGPTSAAIAYKA